jgi:hypothetical protein
MHDNATFIQLPPLGSSTSLITVFGDHRVNIQRTIRSIMQLVGSLLYLLAAKLTRIIRLAITMLHLSGCSQSSSTRCFHLQV